MFDAGRDSKTFLLTILLVGIALKGSIVVIAKAKVPLVKYIDHLTKLKVDISFENDTGVIANHTYRAWQSEFPAMPVLVTLIKQYLLMRNMNEVHTGGLGGFSVACMVVSLMQNMPSLTFGHTDPMANLGELFITFLDFYGNKFNLRTTGIELNPPKYFAKVSSTFRLLTRILSGCPKHANPNH